MVLRNVLLSPYATFGVTIDQFIDVALAYRPSGPEHSAGIHRER